MNKLTKIGASALCGSLAAISAANAGDLTVTGGADMTWTSIEGASTGNPIGIGSNMTFAGNGELENGWTVDLSIALTNAAAYSNTNVTIGVPGVGDIRIDQGTSGTGIQRMDDMTPTVWEEADGAGVSAGITKIMGTSAGATVQYEPSEDMGIPAGLALVAAWSPDADGGGSTNDKASGGGASGSLGSGWDLTATATSDLHGVDGLTVYGGLSQVDQYQNAAAINSDSKEQIIGVKYAMGGFTVGWQTSDDETGRATTNTEYENTSYSVTFQVNDDLSIGYAHIESDVSSTTNVTAEADSLQAAYTMGGASFRIAEVDVENQAYSTAATADVEGTVISLGLAF